MQETTVKDSRHPVLSIVLVLAALGLWLPLLLVAVLFLGGAGGYGAAMAFGIVAIFALKVGAVAVVLLALYAVIAKPWRTPGRAARFFWLQIPPAILVCIGIAASVPGLLSDARHEAQQAHTDDRFRALIDALVNDDADRFSQLLTSCGQACDGPWLDDAVVYDAPRSAGVLLKRLTVAGYRTPAYTEPGERTGCVNDALYYIHLPIAGLVGLHDNPAVTAQFIPFWNRDDLQQALRGAAVGDHVDLMKDLVARGASLREKADGSPENGLIAAAVRGGAVHALNWLAANGVRVRTDDEQVEVWHSLSMWIGKTSVQVSAQRLDALIDALKALGANPAPRASAAIQPLKESIESAGPADGILAAALIRHGAHPEYLSPEIRDALKETLARPAETYAADDATLKRICSTRGKGEALRDWNWPSWTLSELP